MSQEYPDQQSSGSVIVTSVGSIIKAAQEALSLIVNGYTDENATIQSILALVSEYEGKHPAEISVYVKENGNYSYEGYSPFSIIVYTGIQVGDEVRIGRNVSAHVYQTYGKASGYVPMEILYYRGSTTTSAVHIGADKSGGRISTINAVAIGGVPILVQWNSPYDNVILEDSFTIEVL